MTDGPFQEGPLYVHQGQLLERTPQALSLVESPPDWYMRE